MTFVIDAHWSICGEITWCLIFALKIPEESVDMLGEKNGWNKTGKVIIIEDGC